MSSPTPGLPLLKLPDDQQRRKSGNSESLCPSPYASSSPQARSATYAGLTSEQVAAHFSTCPTAGIAYDEARIRYERDGPNELPHEEPEPLWLRFVKQFKETLILLLLGSAALSAFMGNYEDAISIAIAVTIVVTVAFIQEYRSEKSIEALSKLVPHAANVIRSRHRSTSTVGELSLEAAQKMSTKTSATEIVCGDLVLFTTGDRIPADIRITQAVDLTIDESNLTGENEPVQKQTDPCRPRVAATPLSPLYASEGSGAVGVDIRLNEQTNIAFMGTLVRSGYGQGIVVATGGDTEFGAISASLQEIESPRTPLQLSMDRLGQELSYTSFGVIAFIILIGLWRGWPFLELFQIGVSLAVAAIPEGLPIIVTVTLALGVLRMSKRNAIIRRLPSVETLGSVNVICSDKTGTLTMNHMTVTKTWCFGQDEPEDVGQYDASKTALHTIMRIGNIVNNGRLHSGSTHATVASAAVLSSTGSDASKSRWAGQPTDVALLDFADAFGQDDVRQHMAARTAETPFSSERKWMGVVVPASSDAKDGHVGYVKGAVEQVLKRCDTHLDGSSEMVLDEQGRQRILRAAESMANEGLRVLAFASGPVSLDNAYQGLKFAGLLGMNDPPRKGVDRSIRRLMAGGVKVIMITGDAEQTAVAIARKLGMPINMSSAIGSPVLCGHELDRMSDEELGHAIDRTQIFARTSPDHKMKIVKALQAKGHVVAMTGDGVNDAPALKKADIGISMGKLGTDVAKEAADMVLTDDDFSTILNAIEEGKGIFSNIQNFLTFQLSTSASALGLVMLSSAFGYRNPLNAMQILWINILMDGPPAQSLGVEPVDRSLLSLPPRPRQARVITTKLIRRVLQSAVVIMLGTLYTYVSNLSVEDLAAHSVSDRDTTLTFTAFVLFDMFNALTCRSATKSVLRGEVRLFGRKANSMFNFAVAGSLMGQLLVVYFPPLQRVFQTEALSLADLAGLVILASSVFWVDEGRKWWERKGSARLPSGYSSRV